MKITQIKQQAKDQTRVSIFLEGKYSFSLTLDQLLAEKLKKDLELDEVRITQLKKLSEEGKLHARTLEWLLRRPHSEKEMRDYLYRKKVEKDQISALVEEFVAKGYINDESFARWFTEGRMRKNKSSRALEAELRSKGVSPVTIKSIVTELYDVDSEEEMLAKLVNKLIVKPRYSDINKLKRYLLSKGFSYDQINKAVKKQSDD